MERDRAQWLEFFISPHEKEHFANWKEIVNDRSVLNPIFSPIFDYIASYVPQELAPNVLTLAGSFATLQAWYFCRTYADSDSQIVSAVSIVSVSSFWCLGAIDGKHALRTWNDTSLGALFKYCCDLLSSVFLVPVVCKLSIGEVVGADPTLLEDQWYLVQAMQLVLFVKHYSAFVREAGLRYILVGPGELISWAVGILLVSCFFGGGWLKVLYTYTWGIVCKLVMEYYQLDADSYIGTMRPARAIYISAFCIAFFRVVSSPRLYYRHNWTFWSLISILGLRAGSAVLSLCFLSLDDLTERDVILDGLFMALITSDLIVAKMANRDIHFVVTLMAAVVVLPHLHFVLLTFIAFYFIMVFGDLMHYMNMPLLQRCRNVYCDGIYDLCHVGHKNLFRRALSHGNRLFVGVVGDKDANAYKRPPIMSAAERESEVSSCKCVTKVIANAPCFGLTEEFIRKHRIHIVAFGQEYLDRYPDPEDDPYYKVPRKLGIAVPMPRTEGLSTSDLIARIQSRGADEKKPLPPAKRQRTDEEGKSVEATS
jgi:choline-phosphate cytidylyltransferase